MKEPRQKNETLYFDRKPPGGEDFAVSGFDPVEKAQRVKACYQHLLDLARERDRQRQDRPRGWLSHIIGSDCATRHVAARYSYVPPSGGASLVLPRRGGAA